MQVPTRQRTRLRPQREEVRARIIVAAEKEFMARGYAATTMSGVAERAGYTKGAVYSNFESKAELFVSLIMGRFPRVLDEQVADVSGAVAPDEVEQDARVRLLAERLTLLTARDTAWHVLIMELAILAVHDEQAAALYRRSRELVSAMISEVVVAVLGPDRDVGGVTRNDLFAGLIISTVNMVALETALDPDRYRHELRLRTFEAVLRGATRS